MAIFYFLFLFSFLFILFFFTPLVRFPRENFENLFQNKSLGSGGNYPQSEYEALVQDTYPINHRYGVTDNTSADVFSLYPSFKVYPAINPYAQTTNNIRYPVSVDNGTCMPVEFCKTLYQEEPNNSNIVTPLPPAPIQSEGVRVNYYNTPINMLPYRSDMANVLY
jgi:hypothetical protein